MNEHRDYVDQGTRCSKNTVSKNVSRILAKTSVLVNEPKPSSKKINLSLPEKLLGELSSPLEIMDQPIVELYIILFCELENSNHFSLTS